MRWGVRILNIARYVNDIGGTVQKCTSIDDRFDAFWNTLSQKEDKLLCVRNSISLKWRYKYALLEDRVWIYTVEEDHRMIAYAIFFRDDKPELNLKRIRLVDIQTLEEGPGLIFKLLATAEKRCRREGIHMLEAVGFHPRKRQVISKWLPHRRNIHVWPFYQTSDSVLDRELQSLTVWDPCLFDGDGSL